MEVASSQTEDSAPDAAGVPVLVGRLPVAEVSAEPPYGLEIQRSTLRWTHGGSVFRNRSELTGTLQVKWLSSPHKDWELLMVPLALGLPVALLLMIVDACTGVVEQFGFFLCWLLCVTPVFVAMLALMAFGPPPISLLTVHAGGCRQEWSHEQQCATQYALHGCRRFWVRLDTQGYSDASTPVRSEYSLWAELGSGVETAIVTDLKRPTHATWLARRFEQAFAVEEPGRDIVHYHRDLGPNPVPTM